MKTPVGVGGKYKTFGIRKKWLEEFFSDPEKWWVENSLGPIQFEAMRLWLIDAEIIAVKKNKEHILTETGKILKEIGANDIFTWAVIWTNLARNSNLVSWYVSELEWGRTYLKEELIDSLSKKYGKKAIRTVTNALIALFQTFTHTPLGKELEIGVPVREGRKYVAIVKKGVPIQPELKIPALSILYSLYRYAKTVNKFDLNISEFYSRNEPENPYRLFGIPKYECEDVIQKLSKVYSSYIKIRDQILYLNSKNSFKDILLLYLGEKE